MGSYDYINRAALHNKHLEMHTHDNLHPQIEIQTLRQPNSSFTLFI